MTLKRSKLWQGKYVDVRSYELDKLGKDEKLVILYEGKTMTLKPEEIKSKRWNFNTKPIASKIYPGQTYLLYSYLWVPDPELTEAQKAEQFSKDYLI